MNPYGIHVIKRVCVLSLFSLVPLCNAMDCSPPGESVHGILQARILEWIAMPSSRDLLDPGMEPMSLVSPALAGEFFTASTTWETLYICQNLQNTHHQG